MRFALRNQKKISEAYSPEILERILKSLKKQFSDNKPLDIHDGGRYPILLIDDVGHTCSLIAFHVIAVTFDVYNLAFKEFIG
jgi:hypothetical protein